MITSACTLPAAPIAYYLSGTLLGRRFTLVVSTMLAGVFLFLFAFVAKEDSAIAFSSMILLFQNIMYAVL